MIKKVLSYAEKMSIKLGFKRADKDEPKKRPPDDDGIYPPDPITDNPPPAFETPEKPPIHQPGYPVEPPEMGIKPKKPKGKKK